SLLLAIPRMSPAQAPIPYHRQPYFIDSGAQRGRTTENLVAFREVVRVSGASWLQLHIGEHNLGKKSYVSITSLQDGHMQRLDAQSLSEWQNSTAYFNGDAVEVQLHVAPEDDNIFIRTTEVTVGEPAQLIVKPNDICGNTDDRVASN